MGCSSCGTSSNGVPSGCKSNGSCTSGGCNRLNVFDWLANLPFHDPESSCKIIEVSFNNGSRKDFYRNTTLQTFIKGDLITLEGVSGFDVGEVSATGEMVRLQMKKKNVDESSDEIKTPEARQPVSSMHTFVSTLLSATSWIAWSTWLASPVTSKPSADAGVTFPT